MRTPLLRHRPLAALHFAPFGPPFGWGLFIVFCVFLLGACSSDSTNTTQTQEPITNNAVAKAATDAPGDDIPALLEGEWQRTDDPKERFTIAQNTLIRTYEGEKPVRQTMTYVADCGGNACTGQQSSYGCITLAGQFDIDCQAIVAISPTELTLSQGTTTQTVRFRRITP